MSAGTEQTETFPVPEPDDPYGEADNPVIAGRMPSSGCLALLWGGLLIVSLVLVFGGRVPPLQAVALFLMFTICVTGFLFLLSGRCYSAESDVLAGEYRQRGRNLVEEKMKAPNLDECVRTLYQFASYHSTRSIWPITGLFSLGGAIAVGAVVGPPDEWLRTVIVVFLGMMLVQSFANGYATYHGTSQAQFYRDSLYCRYRELRAEVDLVPKFRPPPSSSGREPSRTQDLA